MSTAEDPMALPPGFPGEEELRRLARAWLAVPPQGEPGGPPGTPGGGPPLALVAGLERELRDDVAGGRPLPSEPSASQDPWAFAFRPIEITVAVPDLYSVIGALPATSGIPYFVAEADDLAALPPAPPGRDPHGAFPRATAPPGARPLDPAFVRGDFPILRERIHGRPLVWLDNGATTQKPFAVIERVDRFYRNENSNIHRGAHELAARSTDAYEDARRTVARFLNAAHPDEIVFLRGTTEAINLVAQSWGRQNIEAGDEIVLTHLEHHSNIVPWQQLAREKGAHLRVAPVDDSGAIDLEAYERLFSHRTKLAAFTHVSNALGTIPPVKEMASIAHRYGARVLVDGAQAIAHLPVDVQSLSVDFYVFSGHKMYGPTGIGVLYGRRELLAAMPPWQGGGNMITDVTFERSLYQEPPHRFEAGTGSIADAVGLAAALVYVERLGMQAIEQAEQDLLAYATDRLLAIPGLRLFGAAPHKAGVLSFLLEGYSPEAVGSALNQEGIAVRAGHHCAQPILRRFGVESTVRATLGIYNTRSDVEALVGALRHLQVPDHTGNHLRTPRYS